MTLHLKMLWFSSLEPVQVRSFASVGLNTLRTDRIGIGQTCAQQFALHGCRKLFLVDLSLSGLQATKKIIENDKTHAQVELYEGNVTNESSMKLMIERCVEIYGRLDVACNNAGISGGSARTSDLSVKDFDLLCSVNQLGVSVSHRCH